MPGNLKAEVILEWGDGEYLFALKGDQIEELQHKCGETGKPVGLGAIYQRVMLGVWKWGDLFHTIRLGLIGGGMGAVEANRLTAAYIGQPLVAGPNSPESVAKAILGAVMVGTEILEKPPSSGEAEPATGPASSTSPITEPRSSSPASTPDRSAP